MTLNPRDLVLYAAHKRHPLRNPVCGEAQTDAALEQDRLAGDPDPKGRQHPPYGHAGVRSRSRQHKRAPCDGEDVRHQQRVAAADLDPHVGSLCARRGAVRAPYGAAELQDLGAHHVTSRALPLTVTERWVSSIFWLPLLISMPVLLSTIFAPDLSVISTFSAPPVSSRVMVLPEAVFRILMSGFPSSGSFPSFHQQPFQTGRDASPASNSIHTPVPGGGTRYRPTPSPA